MSKYWDKRLANEISSFTGIRADKLNKVISKLYIKSRDNIISKMEELMAYLEAEKEDGRPLSISDMYKLDKYYKLVGQIESELKSLGNKQLKVLDKELIAYAEDVQAKISSTYDLHFVQIDKQAALEIVKRVWAPDKKLYSDRVWEDKAKLLHILEQGLFNVIVTGESNIQLALDIKEAFNKEIYVAKRLVNTEIAYIQTATALDRYQKSGFKKYQYFTLNDSKVCEKCEDLDSRIYLIADAKIGENCPPIHPQCRCFISPVVI